MEHGLRTPSNPAPSNNGPPLRVSAPHPSNSRRHPGSRARTCPTCTLASRQRCCPTGVGRDRVDLDLEGPLVPDRNPDHRTPVRRGYLGLVGRLVVPIETTVRVHARGQDQAELASMVRGGSKLTFRPALIPVATAPQRLAASGAGHASCPSRRSSRKSAIWGNTHLGVL